MSPVVDMETALSDLPAAIFKTLAAKLEENRGWIEVGKYSQALEYVYKMLFRRIITYLCRLFPVSLVTISYQRYLQRKHCC